MKPKEALEIHGLMINIYLNSVGPESLFYKILSPCGTLFSHGESNGRSTPFSLNSSLKKKKKLWKVTKEHISESIKLVNLSILINPAPSTFLESKQLLMMTSIECG